MPIGNVARLVSAALAASLTTAHAQGMLRAPTPPAPKANADLVGLIIENLAAHPLPASPVTFGQAFLPGHMPAKAGMVARIDGKDVPVQVDAKTTYPDGSLRMAVLSLTAPPMPAHAKAPMMLVAAAPASGNAVDLARLADGKAYDLSIDLTFHQEDGTTAPFHLDAAPLLAKALAEGKTRLLAARAGRERNPRRCTGHRLVPYRFRRARLCRWHDAYRSAIRQ